MRWEENYRARGRETDQFRGYTLILMTGFNMTKVRALICIVDFLLFYYLLTYMLY